MMLRHWRLMRGRPWWDRVAFVWGVYAFRLRYQLLRARIRRRGRP